MNESGLSALSSGVVFRQGVKRCTLVWLEQKFLLLKGYVAGYFLLFYGYYIYLAPKWTHYGFFWHPDWSKVMEALCYVVVISLLLPSSVRKPSDFFLHLQFLFPILPMLVMFGASGQPRQYMYSVLLAFLMLFIVVRKVKFKPLRVPRISINIFQDFLLIIGYSVIVSIVLWGGMSYFNLSFAKVYIYRGIAASNLPSIYGYINSWVSKVVFPFSLLLAVLTGSKLRVVFSFIGSVLMFGLTSHKGVLFYPFAVLLVYWIMGRRKDLALMLLLGGYHLMIVLSLLDHWSGLFHGWVATLGLRRAIFVPALLNFDYYNFFSQYGFVYWAQSKITFGIISYKFALDVPYLIGWYYFGSPATGANTGWLGSGYANAGVIGILVYAIVIGFLLALLDVYVKFHDKRVIISVLSPSVLAIFASSDLLTALFTHGVLLGLCFLLLFRTYCTAKVVKDGDDKSHSSHHRSSAP